MITINPNPLMTQFLVKEGVFRDEPFVIVDVGARGGLAPHWDVLNPYMRAYCFEPAVDECARLNALAPAHLTYIPKGLWHTPGKQTLYVTRLADSAGLYKNGAYFNRFVNAGNGEVVAEQEIECTTLAECITSGEVPNPDFLKLDAEGGEWDIWRGALGHAKPLGIVSEIRFHREINGCDPFHIIDLGLRCDGYSLYDLTFGYQSRKDLPYPQCHRSVAQDGRQFMGLTTRGQIQDGDALYFRDPLLPGGNLHDMTAIQILKLACLMEVYSLSDCAAELILKSRLSPFMGANPPPNIERCLDLLASGMAGEVTTYEAYRRAYFG
jgi:FkbM family methyltransferase